MASQSDLTQRILNDLANQNSINSLEYSRLVGEEHQRIVGAIKSLETLDNVISVSSNSVKCWSCTEEGLQISKEGSHEARLFAWLPSAGASVDAIKKEFPTANVALGAALKNKWVQKDGQTVVRAVESISDAVQGDLQAVAAGDSARFSTKQLGDYKKRKLIKDSDVTVFTVTKGAEFTTTISKQEAELTKEMIESGQWKTKTFKPFNFRAKGKQETRPGHLHPLMQLRSEFRQIFLEMGFSEMPTNSFVESAFWNFDALFQPQQHPARDAHDTFYVKTPGRALSVPKDYMRRVRQVHSEGGYGSSGYRYPWSEEEAHKNLLRTHTTAVSARMLHKLAQDGFRPAKYFSIDRVFRNETLDATHLAEFHQIEGVVADYDLSVKHLIGMFTAFFEKIGIKNLRFKATYNPYTEPSMEIYSFHDGLGKWVEVGNSGLFRPEMLRPMGLPPNVSVLGWGLSLERPAMIMFGSNNIRELVGPRVKMELVYNNPICTVDKFQTTNLRAPVSSVAASSCDPALGQLSRRQDRIFNQLNALQARVRQVAAKMDVPLTDDAAASDTKAADDTHDILGGLTGAPTAGAPIEVVITAHPHRPPHSLPSLLALLALVTPAAVHVHTHSSVSDLPATLKNFLNGIRSCQDPVVRVRLIWSCDLVPKSPSFGSKIPSPRLMVSPHNSTEIAGENNICRYLARLIEVLTKGASWGQLRAPLYEALPLYLVSECDAWLDDCQAWLITGTSRGRANFLNKLSNKLGESDESSCWLISQHPTLADLFVAANLACLGRTARVAMNVAAWRDRSLSYWLSANKS